MQSKSNLEDDPRQAIDWMIQSSSKANPDDDIVGALALVSMYQVVKFLLLQVLWLLLFGAIEVLSASNGWSRETTDTLTITLFVMFETGLMIYLAKNGKVRFDQYMELRRRQATDTPADVPVYFTTSITETHLEIAIATAALAGIGWCLFLGMEAKALLIVLTVVEGAALLFLFIFVTIRFLVTRKIRPTAILCLILTCLSLWTLQQ